MSWASDFEMMLYLFEPILLYECIRNKLVCSGCSYSAALKPNNEEQLIMEVWIDGMQTVKERSIHIEKQRYIQGVD